MRCQNSLCPRRLVRGACRRLRLAALLTLLFFASPALAGPCGASPPAAGAAFTGIVVLVLDGATYCVGLGPDPIEWVEVRAADITAPSLDKISGRESRAALATLLIGQTVTCVASSRSDDHVVAICAQNGRSVGASFRAAGLRDAENARLLLEDAPSEVGPRPDPVASTSATAGPAR